MYTYHNQCDRFRRTEQGESDWHEMMGNKSIVDNGYFLSVCDWSSFSDDETLDQFTADDPDSACYSSKFRDTSCYFVQTAGFEFIFIKD